MKTLLLGDVHIHPYSKFGQKDSISLPTRLAEQREVLNQVKDTIISRKIDKVEFAGDWYHSDKAIPIECLNVTKEFFKFFQDNKVYFNACRGNHDLVNKVTPTNYQYSLAPHLELVSPTPEKLEQEFKVYRIHYDTKVNYDEIVGYDLVIGHKMPLGSKSAQNYTFDEGVDWRILADNNTLVVFGHNHTPQKLSNNCFVLGSLMPLTYGDLHSASVWVLEGDKLENVPLKSAKFITVVKDDDVKEDGNYYRVLGNSKIQSSRVISVKEPTYFEQRIKETTLDGILKEWANLQCKDKSYFNLIKDDLINSSLYDLTKIQELKLESVYIKDFGSFGEASFKVGNGLIVIEGRSEGFSSNGSGKSSLIDSIYWVLTGETTKGITGDDVIRKYPKKQKDCLVKIHLRSKDSIYSISRSRKSGIEIWENDKLLNEGLKLKESQEMLDSIVGFNKMVFLLSTYFSQENMLLLTKLGTSETTSIITTLLNFENYDKLGNVVLSKKNAINVNKGIISRQIANLEGKLEELKRVLNIYLQQERAYLANGLAKKQELLEANTQLSSLEALQETFEVIDTLPLESNLSGLKADLEQMRGILNVSQGKIDELEAKLTLLKENDEYIELKSQLPVEISNFNRIRKEIEILNNLKDGSVCNYCGSLITLQHKQEYIDKFKVQLKIMETNIISIENKLNIINKDIEINNNSLKEVKEEYNKVRKNYNSKQEEITNLSNKIIDINKKNTQGSQKLLEINKQKNRVEIIKNELQQIRINHTNIKNTILENSNSVKKVEEELLENRNKDAQATKDIEILDFWGVALSYKGVKSLLIDGFCNEFNNILKNYICDISNGIISMELSPTSQTKSGEARNKLDLNIEIGGIQRSYASLSGGEKKRCDIAICLTLSKWIQNRFGLGTSLLGIQIFDELFDGLDSSAEDCIAPVLKKEAENKVVFLISHTKEMSNYADRVITVIKENMISRIADA